MGLRIQTNLPSLIALRNLRATDVRQQRNLERLSTGSRINRASDDPTGLALSETLRAQLRALRQVGDNSRNAGGLVNTAEAALSEVTDLLHDLRRSLVFAMGSTGSDAQVAAEQESVDAALAAIRRIAATTRYDGVPLLNGSAGFTFSSVDVSGILEVRPVRIRFNPVTDPTPFTVNVTTAAQQATALPGAVSGGSVQVLVGGPVGSAVVNLASGTSAAAAASAIGALRGFTGIYASAGSVFTEAFGSEARVRLEILSGPGTLGGLAAGDVLLDAGGDAVAQFQGTSYTGRGNLLSIHDPYFNGEIELQPYAAGAYSFSVQRSGMLFQLGVQTASAHQETIGIPDMSPEALGRATLTIGGETTGGFLSTLFSGNANDLLSDPENGLRILDLALEDVSSARAALGSFVAHVVEPVERSSEVAAENLSAADSTLRDADFAEEIAEMTRNQVLFQSGISVLGQTQKIPETVLRLLLE